MLLISEPVQETAEEMELSGDGIERRRGLRIRDTRPVKIFDSAAAKYFGGRTEDISATGLRIELPSYAPVEPGDMLNVHVGLNRAGEPLANRRQMIPARVIWVNRQDKRIAGRLEVGIEFLAGIAARLDAA
jgi:hypothetical protein